MSDDDREKINGRTWVGRNQYRHGKEVFGDYATDGTDQPMGAHPRGRWPANVILDESQAENLGDESRFFFTAKANTHERPRIDGAAHPTVKPLTLMRYLVRLVTPPGGIVLEPFAGSGTTLEACIVEGFKCIGIERDPTYLDLIVQRVSKPIQVTLL